MKIIKSFFFFFIIVKQNHFNIQQLYLFFLLVSDSQHQLRAITNLHRLYRWYLRSRILENMFVSVYTGVVFNDVYTASKFAIEGFCESLAVQLLKFNVKSVSWLLKPLHKIKAK